MASFSVVSNIASTNAQANLYGTQVGLQKALTRLSSGFRINVSGDDAAGLAVANTYRSDNAVITQGIRNANDGLSVLQVKDGALGNVSTLLDRLSTLATQAASAGTSGVDIKTLQDEADSIVVEIERELNVAGLHEQANFGVFISNDSISVAGTPGASDQTEQYQGADGADVTLTASVGGYNFSVTVATADLTGDDSTMAGRLENIAIMEAAITEQLRVDNHEDYTVTREADGSWTIAAPGTPDTQNVGQVTGSLKAISLGTGVDANTIYLGIKNGSGFLDLDANATAAADAVAQLKEGLKGIGEAQGAIGTLQNKLSFAISLAQSQQVNKAAAESRIRDANIAEESANMTRYNILTQSGIAALAQANQSTSSVLALLR
jgi:flagellin